MTSDTAIAPGLAAGWCRWCSLPTLLLLLLLLPVCVVQVESSSEASPLSPTLLAFSERFLELLIDLLSQLPTRRFFKAVLQVGREACQTILHRDKCHRPSTHLQTSVIDPLPLSHSDSRSLMPCSRTCTWTCVCRRARSLASRGWRRSCWTCSSST